MVVSNEPGYYLKDEFGIRCENLVFIKSEGDNFYTFENLTMVKSKFFDDKNQKMLTNKGGVKTSVSISRDITVQV